MREEEKERKDRRWNEEKKDLRRRIAVLEETNDRKEREVRKNNIVIKEVR